MRNYISRFLGLAILVAALGCSKQDMANTPCDFKITIDEVRATKIKFTITPDNDYATYVYGIIPDAEPMNTWTDKELMDWQLKWMEDTYTHYEQVEELVGTFSDIFCYHGQRQNKDLLLTPDSDYYLLVYQIDTEKRIPIGSLYRRAFRTKHIETQDITFKIQCQGDYIRIVPSNPGSEWFWEYETDERIRKVYGDNYTFFYAILDMYDEYDFLDNLVCHGDEEWVFSRDDPSIMEDTEYTLAISGCAEGEINSEVYYASFFIRNGEVVFDEHQSDIPIEHLLQ